MEKYAHNQDGEHLNLTLQNKIAAPTFDPRPLNPASTSISVYIDSKRLGYVKPTAPAFLRLLNSPLLRNIRSNTLTPLRSATGDFRFYELIPASHINIWLNETIRIFNQMQLKNLPKTQRLKIPSRVNDGAPFHTQTNIITHRNPLSPHLIVKALTP
jgi:hypothetical protein